MEEASTSAVAGMSGNAGQSGNSDANKCEPTDASAALGVDEFLSTGRTGRRNALPDILEQKSSHDNTADLPNEMQKLSFSDSTQHNGNSGDRSESIASTSCCSGNQNK